jgi:hypothetical protein
MNKIKKIMEYLKKSFRTIVESIKPQKKLFITLAIDIILLLMIIGAIAYYDKTTIKTYQQLETLIGANTIDKIMQSSPEIVTQGIKEIIYNTYALIIYTIILWIISRTAVHSIMYSQKMFTKQNLKFLGINTLSTTTFLLIAYATLKIIKEPISYFAIIILALLYLHEKQAFYHAATHKKSIKEGLKAIISVGIGKARYFILPTITAILMFILINIIASLISKLVLLVPKTNITSAIIMSINALAILYIISWTRNYWKNVTDNIKV